MTLPTPPAKSGYTFGGWYTEEDGNGTKVTGSTPVSGDLGPVDGTVTLHAKWTVIGGGAVSYTHLDVYKRQSYTVDRSSAVTLPVPIRDGYTFGGWYDNPSCTGTALTIVPPGSVGDLTYYAKWFNKADSALSGVTVLGVSAVTDNSDDTGMTYVAELPHGTDLTAITAEDIKAVPANGETAVVEPVPESGGAAWIVTFEAGTGIVEYTIRFIVSKNAAPLVADGQEFQSDSAAPSSYDGKTPAVPYVAIV